MRSFQGRLPPQRSLNSGPQGASDAVIMQRNREGVIVMTNPPIPTITICYFAHLVAALRAQKQQHKCRGSHRVTRNVHLRTPKCTLTKKSQGLRAPACHIRR